MTDNLGYYFGCPADTSHTCPRCNTSTRLFNAPNGERGFCCDCTSATDSLYHGALKKYRVIWMEKITWKDLPIGASALCMPAGTTKWLTNRYLKISDTIGRRSGIDEMWIGPDCFVKDIILPYNIAETNVEPLKVSNPLSDKDAKSCDTCYQLGSGPVCKNCGGTSFSVGK